ncbi:hypothetical protein RRG08_031829 [Elysia crispata]|uniref:Uncharacterized protein n=1 Tax=Elysia crispata TaxID=231223 RepID=A0AAE0Y5L9_9GAST|nr:hypothetical protein RRG08_031829 [Elysia crispata]
MDTSQLTITMRISLGENFVISFLRRVKDTPNYFVQGLSASITFLEPTQDIDMWVTRPVAGHMIRGDLSCEARVTLAAPSGQ